MGDVIELNCSTTGEIPVDKILTHALGENLKNVIVIGETADGASIHFAVSMGDAPLINFLLDCAKKAILDDSAPDIGDE